MFSHGLMQASTSVMNPEESTASSVTRKTIQLRDMSDEEYFRYTPGEVVNKSTEYDVENLTREYIVPKIKFITDTDEEWKWPGLTDTTLDSTKILDILLEKLGGNAAFDARSKMDFWTTYRKSVKNVLNNHRANSREKMKKLVLYGESLHTLQLFLIFIGNSDVV